MKNRFETIDDAVGFVSSCGAVLTGYDGCGFPAATIYGGTLTFYRQKNGIIVLRIVTKYDGQRITKSPIIAASELAIIAKIK